MKRSQLRSKGFRGFRAVKQMLNSELAEITEKHGVYAVLRVQRGPPRFLSMNPGGRFKGQDPTVSPSELRRRWVSGVEVLYIGKAAGKKGLRGRIRKLMRFASGQAVSHWGGRLLWQVSGRTGFLVAWLPTPGQNAREVERRLLRTFEGTHGKLPFANMTH